jgi:pyruvate/2-oxoglutarate dehydrogenase complex dihydrolipoamide acyltransferase (E2) component
MFLHDRYNYAKAKPLCYRRIGNALVQKEGDHVREGELLLEIETIKATTDIEAPGSGTIVRILVQEGQFVKCETLLAEIEAQKRR